MPKDKFKENCEIPINCQWLNCCFNTKSRFNFTKHVKEHIPQLEVVTNAEGNQLFKCLWQNCLFETDDNAGVIWHVKYHGYHALLKADGDVLAKSKNLPACTLPDIENNTIPSRDVPPICEWNSCNQQFTGQVEFIEHVNYDHFLFMKTKPKQRVKCLWAGCNLTTSKKSKLADHVKMHTGDKANACSQCGQIFANTTKFVNHCHRQMPINENSPKCQHCPVYLPNERLLKIHMRQHVHHYKCSFCDLTCTTPSILSTHIKYRHMPFKPYKCTSCSYVCKSQNDLNRHMQVHSDNFYKCSHVNCNSKYRSELSVARHYLKAHSVNPQLKTYSCHLCPKTYSRGGPLTKHICQVHNVNKTSGYSRFEYKREEDGYSRLQTTRLESLEVEELPVKYVGAEFAKSGIIILEEEVDDPSPIGEEGVEKNSRKIVAIDVIDNEGKIITSNEVITEDDLPPEAKIVAIGE